MSSSAAVLGTGPSRTEVLAGPTNCRPEAEQSGASVWEGEL